MPRTIVLAYSGGLDTSIIVPWLRENYDARVICVAADIGQGSDELRGVREKALASGAEECYIEDLREEFVRDFIFPTLRAGAIYNRKYLLGTAMARPLIAKRQVEVARRVGADALAHGCTGKGNDQVRFELTFATLAPGSSGHRAVARVGHPQPRGRDRLRRRRAASRSPRRKEKIYSRDANLWHLSHEGGNLEDPNSAPKPDMFMLTTEPAQAPDAPEDVVIGFEQGTPVIGQRQGARSRRTRRRAQRDRRPARRRPYRSRRGSHGRHEVARRLRDAGRHAALHGALGARAARARPPHARRRRTSSRRATPISCTRVAGGPPSARRTTRS